MIATPISSAFIRPTVPGHRFVPGRRLASRRGRIGAGLRGLSILLAAWLVCAPFAGQAAPRAPDELVIGISQYPATLHPNIDSMLAKVYVLGLLRRPVVVYDPKWVLRCMLCESLPTLENGGAQLEPLPPGQRMAGRTEGIAVTYTLNRRAVWGDGRPITSDDVIFTWKVGRDPRSGVASQETYRRIWRIDRLSERRFTLHLDRVTFDYNALTLEILPRHLEAPIFEADPTAYRHRTLFETDPTRSGLHFGPYRLTRVERGSYLVFERNPRWWGRRPYFRRIVVRAIEKTAALEANLLSGTVDYVAGELGFSLDQALAFEVRHRGDFRVLYKPGLIYEHIDFNLDNPVLGDRRVRRALAHGIDRSAISSQLFGGKQPVAATNVSPLDWVYEPDVPRYPYDPAKAGELLDSAGWHRTGRGVRRNPSGEPLRLELMTTAGNRTRELVEQVLQSQWRRIGVEVTLHNEPARVFFGETVARRKFPAMAMYAWISSPESVPRTTLHSSEIPTAGNGWSGQNATGYRSREMDRVIDRIETTLDRKRRKALWSKLQKIYARDLPVLPLYFRANAYPLPIWLGGIRPTGHQFPTTLWVEDWKRTGE